MAKISGFVMSALLVVLCLWLSVFSFPDAIQPGDLAILDKIEAPEQTVAPIETSASQTSVHIDAAAAVQSQEVERPAKEEETSKSTDESAEKAPTQAVLDRAADSHSELAQTSLAAADQAQSKSHSEPEDALKASGRAQGGKYVSIPSVGIDAYNASAYGASRANRVVGATRAVVPQIDSAYN